MKNSEETYFCLLLLQLLSSLSFLDDPFTDFFDAFSRTGFILQQITLEASNLEKKKEIND